MEKAAAGTGELVAEEAPRLRWRSRGTLLLLGVLALYFWICLLRSATKPLWFDELGTLNVAGQPTLQQMFRVEPGDGNPPLQYLLVRLCLHVLGTHALALRLPAMLGVSVAIVCAYLFVSRRFGTAAGLTAATLIVFTPISDYGVEARPYGLLVGLVGLLLVLWQRATSNGARHAAVQAGIALTVFALVTTQPLGFLWVVVPLGAAEVCRRWRSGRWDWGMVLAVALGLTGFAITFHFGQATQHVLVAEGSTRHPAISTPSLGKLNEALQDYGFLPALAGLGLTAAVALLRRRKPAQADGARPPGAPLHEWVAVIALALSLFVIYVFTLAVTHYFWGRYLLPGILGCYLLVAMAGGAVRRIEGSRHVLLALLMLCIPLSLYFRYRTAMKKTPWPPPAAVYSLLKEADHAEPVVISSPVLFSEICWYAPAELRPRLHYVADAHEAEATDDFVGDLTLIAFRNAGAERFAPDTLQFLQRTPRFLLWEAAFDPGDWIKEYLPRKGYRLTQVAFDAAGNRLWQVEKR